MRKFLLALLALIAAPLHAEDWQAKSTERDITLKQFHFGNGETMDLRIHVTTLGKPHRNAKGEIDNAVMVLHGTGGSGWQFFRPQFADELYGPGQVLDISKYYVILPDNIGHGKSSRPSDGLKMAFPRYDYDDMVRAQHDMLTQGLGVNGLELILGTSMGCMHAFTWGETYPGFARHLAPFACNATAIAGRNRMWRKMAIEAIKADPAWNGGNYTIPPEAGIRTAKDLSIIAGANAWGLQVLYPTREKAEAALHAAYYAPNPFGNDANDMIYWYDSSRSYDPSADLEKITVPVLWINSADDFINPPEMGMPEQMVARMPHARFVLIPYSPETKGHGTHTWARFWKDDLAKLLAE